MTSLPQLRSSVVFREDVTDLDEGKRHDGLTTEEHEELVRLRREVRTLPRSVRSQQRAAAWFAREGDSNPPKRSGSQKPARPRTG